MGDCWLENARFSQPKRARYKTSCEMTGLEREYATYDDGLRTLILSWKRRFAKSFGPRTI